MWKIKCRGHGFAFVNGCNRPKTVKGEFGVRSIFDITRIQFFVSAVAVWVVLAIVLALLWNFSSGAECVAWGEYELAVVILTLPYVITIVLVNIFCVFRRESGYESK